MSKNQNCCINFKIWGYLAIALFTLVASPVLASDGGTTGGICMVDRYNNLSMPGAPKTKLGCTSNDVSLAIFEIVSGPTTCIAGETVMVQLAGDFIATSAEREDVGVFIAEDGGTPNATGGVCYSDYLHPVAADNSTDLDYFCQNGTTVCTTPTTTPSAECPGIGDETCRILSSGAGPYYNSEISEDPADVCGDIKKDIDARFITGMFPIVCSDSDGDLLADVTSCTVWANSKSNGGSKASCTDETDVSADTTAKCTCDTINIIGITVLEDAYIEVVKNLVPASDPGLFNLEIAGTSKKDSASDGDSTGMVMVSAGTKAEPGDTHSVGESAVTGTMLDSYMSSISCVDRGLGTFNRKIW